MSDPTHQKAGGRNAGAQVTHHLAENMVKKPLSAGAFCKNAPSPQVALRRRRNAGDCKLSPIVEIFARGQGKEKG